ncbi:MAG: hypothetical protein AAF211_05255 [Myxococcota bacterium]
MEHIFEYIRALARALRENGHTMQGAELLVHLRRLGFRVDTQASLSTDLELARQSLREIERQLPVAIAQGEEEVAAVLRDMAEDLRASIARLRERLIRFEADGGAFAAVRRLLEDLQDHVDPKELPDLLAAFDLSSE